MPMDESKNLATAEFLTAAEDPVLCNMEMPLRGIFHPLGYTVEITTNSAEVLAAAEESWGHCRKVFSEPAVEFRVGVTAGDGECPRPPQSCRAWKNLMTTISDPENFSVCDLRRGVGFAWLTQAAVEERAFLRYYFLEASVLTLLDSVYLTPLHAACVRLENRGFLLCGDSGAGKSSLAYACALRGWTFISDDACCLIRGRKDSMVVGHPHKMRFREAGIELFPELRKQKITPRATGEMAIELATDTVEGISTALTSTVDCVIFLNRRDPEPPSLGPFPKETALSWFSQVICYGEDEVRHAQIASVRTLLQARVLELRYRDLDWAVNRLEALAREGA